MSELWDVATNKEFLVCGYVRESTVFYVPVPLKRIILNFFDIVIVWNFNDNKMDEFLGCDNAEELFGPIIELDDGQDNEIVFENTMKPNGCMKLRLGFVEYYLKLKKISSNIKCITVYHVFSMLNPRYLMKVTGQYSAIHDWECWSGKGMKLENCKQLKSLKFGCYFEILSIEYKDGSIKSLSDIMIYKSVKYEWIIKDEELKRLKGYAVGQHLYGNNFNNDCFCIYISPKGWNDENKNTFSFQLKLIKLPDKIQSIDLIFSMKCNELQFKWNDIKELKLKTDDNDQRKSGWPQEKNYKIPSSKIKDLDELTLSISICIAKVYGKGDIEIEKDKWSDYGIIDKCISNCTDNI